MEEINLRKSKSSVNYYLFFVIAVVLFALGLPLFLFFRPSSYQFEAGGVVLLAAIVSMLSGLGEIAK